MHVVIVGAGEIGWYLAERLSAEHHNVVVVETDPARASLLGTQLDVQVVVGSGTHPSVLRDAGIETADLVAAVTQDDEVNLVASVLAHEFSKAQTVVRLQNHELAGDAHVLKTVGADLVIDPDADTAEEVLELVHATGADEAYTMGGGLMMLGGVIRESAPWAHRDLASLARESGSHWPFLVGAVTRDGITTIPRGNETLLPNDHLRVLVTTGSRSRVLELMGIPGQRARRVMILGGGAIGSAVATRLHAEGVDVTLVERDLSRAQHLAESLPRIYVVHGEITDTELLVEERIGDMDAVVAATGEDSSNILACALAASEGDPFTIAVLHRLALLPLTHRFAVNAALSPRTASANAVLRFIRGGTTSVMTFLESDVEVDEFVVEQGSPADGSAVSDLHLPHELLLGAVIRPGATNAEIVRGSTRLQANDHVVVFSRPDALASVRSTFLTTR